MFGTLKTYSSSGFLWGPIDIWEEKVVFPQLCMKIVWTTCRFHSLCVVYFAPWWCLRNLPITQCGDIFIFKYLVCQVFCFTDLPVYSFLPSWMIIGSWSFAVSSKGMKMFENEGLEHILSRSRCHKGRLLYYFPAENKWVSHFIHNSSFHHSFLIYIYILLNEVIKSSEFLHWGIVLLL